MQMSMSFIWATADKTIKVILQISLYSQPRKISGAGFDLGTMIKDAVDMIDRRLMGIETLRAIFCQETLVKSTR